MRRDSRSEEAQAWRQWYKTTAWLKLRQWHLRSNPLCVMCQAEGRTTAANVVDHVEPHKGDRERFFSGPFQSLCATHHNATKQREEHRGPSRVIGLDGWPAN